MTLSGRGGGSGGHDGLSGGGFGGNESVGASVTTRFSYFPAPPAVIGIRHQVEAPVRQAATPPAQS